MVPPGTRNATYCTMSEHDLDRATVILSRSWKLPESELSFVTRSVAGAASRTNPVVVVVPAAAGQTQPDGAFDLFGAGVGDDGSWPGPSEAAWPDGLPTDSVFLIDEPDPAIRSLLDRHAPGAAVYAMAPDDAPVGPRPIARLQFTDVGRDGDTDFIRLHVPINPMAATHRHNGLGFTDYLLVLSDRSGAPDISPPTAMAAWLSASYPDQNVVVVEEATAAVWRGRVLRGVVPVYTRTDLWRLIAHARVTVDLAPGPIIARECIESLRFGTPILVPAGSAAQPYADAGGGVAFAGVSELVAGVSLLFEDPARAAMSSQGQRYADSHYGNREAFVSSVCRALGSAVPSGR
jgi:hypothetical protein